MASDLRSFAVSASGVSYQAIVFVTRLSHLARSIPKRKPSLSKQRQTLAVSSWRLILGTDQMWQPVLKGYSLAIISRTVAMRFLSPAIFSGHEPPV
jgi:hypothetical protein